MSQRREQLAERLPFLDSALEYVEAWYHIPVLVALVAFMFWIRVRNWKNFLVKGQVYFSGNDAWYHLREVRYTVRHWPGTMPFDPWTGFPEGKAVGQFGTLYDQLVATAALVVGGGNPSPETTALALLFAPAVLGTLVLVPAYFLGKRFGGRFGGVVGVAVLAFSSGTFLSRSIAGFSDHQAAETLFQVLAVAAIVTALAVAEREKPVYEQFREREFATLRRPVGWAALAGLTFSLYVWVWPPGILLVGIFGVFLLVSLPLAYLRGESPEHVAIVSAVALAVAGILMAITFKTTQISASSFSLLQPALSFAGAVGCVFMAWLAREIESRDLPTLAYPGTILGLLVVAVVVMALSLPDLFSFFVGQLMRVVGFGSSATSLTVGEAQPPFQVGVPFGTAASQAFGFLLNSYGLALLTAIAGAGLMLYRLTLSRSRRRATAVFVLLWTAFMTAATLTQRRFDYYLVVPVVVLNAFFVGWVLRYVGSTDVRANIRNLRTSQILTVIVVVLFITAPLAAGGGAALTAAGATADTGSHPGSSVRGWDGSLGWLANNTPAEDTYGGANNQMAYYGTYNRTADFNYPSGAYGVLSWWDYGHWITTLGHRIPVANPFQQHATLAANYLLATNPSQANHIARTDGSGMRYVMIDWKMADPAGGGLFSAPFAWYTNGSVSIYDDVTPIAQQTRSGQARTLFLAYKQRHYETMRTRLYTFHGSAIEPGPVVLDYDIPQTRADGSLEAAFVTGNASTAIKRFDNMSAARQYVKQDGTAQIGGVGRYPEHRVPALEHYRLVHGSQENAIGGPSGFGPLARSALQQIRATGLNATELYNTPTNWVKTFERVPGARVRGHGPPNTTVETTVEMRMASTNTTFNYTQQAKTDEQGRFTMTLPYSTTGYDNWGQKQGATNVSVRATGPYTFQTPVTRRNGGATRWYTTANVPEGAVIGRTDKPVRVSLHRESVSNTTATSASSPNTTNARTTAGNQSPGNRTTNATNSGTVTATTSSPTNASATAGPATRVASVAPNKRVRR